MHPALGVIGRGSPVAAANGSSSAGTNAALKRAIFAKDKKYDRCTKYAAETTCNINEPIFDPPKPSRILEIKFYSCRSGRQDESRRNSRFCSGVSCLLQCKLRNSGFAPRRCVYDGGWVEPSTALGGLTKNRD